MSNEILLVYGTLVRVFSSAVAGIEQIFKLIVYFLAKLIVMAVGMFQRKAADSELQRVQSDMTRVCDG